jgi:hypothetical protein
MPLLLHNCQEIANLFIFALDGSDDEALRALLEYVLRFIIVRLSG